MKKVCLVFRALPGAGKNFVIANLLANLKSRGYYDLSLGLRLEGDKATVVSADDYFTDSEGIYRFDMFQIGEAHKDCMKRFLLAVGSGDDLVIVNNTNVNAVEIAPYMQVANAFDYETYIVHVMAKIEDCIRRNVHGVPAHTIGGMRESMVRERLPDYWKVIKVMNDEVPS